MADVDYRQPIFFCDVLLRALGPRRWEAGRAICVVERLERGAAVVADTEGCFWGIRPFGSAPRPGAGFIAQGALGVRCTARARTRVPEKLRRASAGYEPGKIDRLLLDED
jgi:hypothetical protein